MKCPYAPATRLVAQSVFLLLGACSGRPIDSSDFVGSGPAMISGTVSYRERMALAPDDTIRVVLEDVSIADVAAPVIAEQMIAGAGKQVPIPFALTYDKGWIQDHHRYAIRAQIRAADGGLLFTTDTAHPVIMNGAPAQEVEIHVVRAGTATAGMVAQRPGQTAVFDCNSNAGAFSFTTRTGPGEIALWLPPEFGKPYLVLGQIRAASGARYLGDGVLLWNKVDEALLDVDGIQYHGCVLNRRSSIWEHAKLSGVDFRAVGNEPGWHLEIRDADSIRFVYDYGLKEINTSAPELTLDNDNRSATYSVKSEGGEIEVTIVGEPCSDTMSGEAFESRVSVLLDDQTYHGCGRALH